VVVVGAVVVVVLVLVVLDVLDVVVELVLDVVVEPCCRHGACSRLQDTEAVFVA